ncbi:MAG: hypothetical protein LBM18_04370 [Oscillospiraceae bacterium]|jgi:hypothetical protein|nr:hypothetical protein [Oscillospiraceae bacterium]
MKCNHCENEAVYSEDFAVWASISKGNRVRAAENMGKIAGGLIVGVIIGVLLGGVLAGVLGAVLLGLAGDNSTYRKCFMGFIRVNSCKDCIDREVKKKTKNYIKQLLISLLPLIIGIIGMVAIMAKPMENFDTFIWIIFLSITVCSMIYITYITISFFKYKGINFEDACKAPLCNWHSVKDHLELDEKNKSKTIDLTNENCHNEIWKNVLTPNIVRPLKKFKMINKSRSDTSIDDIIWLYLQLANKLTPEIEAARVELLHSRLK